jgi:hypothetical protein
MRPVPKMYAGAANRWLPGLDRPARQKEIDGSSRAGTSIVEIDNKHYYDRKY